MGLVRVEPHPSSDGLGLQYVRRELAEGSLGVVLVYVPHSPEDLTAHRLHSVGGVERGRGVMI